MKNRFCDYLIFSAFFSNLGWSAQATEKSAEPALTRATLYQAEVRTVLSKHHWQIFRDEAGKLVLDHPIVPNPTITPVVTREMAVIPLSGYHRLTLEFQPKSTTDTPCTATFVDYYDSRHMSPSMIQMLTGAPPPAKPTPLIGPLPSHDPNDTKDLQKTMAEAAKHLKAKHPEYGSK